MGMYISWLNSAAEEAKETLLKSSMDVCSQIRKDGEADHDSLDSLHWCWQTMHEMEEKETPVKKEEPSIQQPAKPAAVYSYNNLGSDKFNSSRPASNPDDYVTVRMSG